MSGYSGKEISGPVEKIKKLQKGERYWTDGSRQIKLKAWDFFPNSKRFRPY